MPQPNIAQFGPTANPLIAPDIAAQQLALQRQQQIADFLKQQALTPLESQTVTGAGPSRVVPINPLAGLAKMLTGYVAGQDQGNIDQQSLNLNRQYAQQLGALMSQDDGSNPSGMNLARALKGSVLGSIGGDKAAETYYSQFKPTDATLAANQGNMDPITANRLDFIKKTSDPTVLKMRQGGMSDGQIYDAIYGEAAKGASQTLRPDQSLYSFNTNGVKLNAVAPNPADNMQFQVGPNNSVSASQVPGAPQAVGTAQAARTAGQQSETIRDVTTASGAVVPTRGKNIGNGTINPDADQTSIYQTEMANAQARLQQVKANPQATPADLARAQQDVDGLTREMTRLRIPLGQSTQDKGTQESAAKMITELPSQIVQSKQTVQGLQNAYTLAQRSGPGVSSAANVAAILGNMGLPVAKDDVTNFQTLKKFLENSASTAAASNGFTGSDARFEQFKAGQPNADTMSPDALKGAIRYVLSQHDAAIARGNFILNQAKTNPNDPNAVQNASQQFSRIYNPKVFEFNRMTPQEQTAFVKTMNGQQLQQFRQQYLAAEQQGWVQ